jgi:hypothetical protein
LFDRNASPDHALVEAMDGEHVLAQRRRSRQASYFIGM